MLSVAHAPTGALIATAVPNPFLSIPLVLAAHYFEDWIPHWDVGTGISSHKKKSAAFYQELFLDFPGSILLVYFLFQFGHQGVNWHAWLGWFISLLPDFIDFPELFLKIKLPFLDGLKAIHQRVHRSTPDIVQGLLPQLVVIALVYLLR